MSLVGYVDLGLIERKQMSFEEESCWAEVHNEMKTSIENGGGDRFAVSVGARIKALWKLVLMLQFIKIYVSMAWVRMVRKKNLWP